MKQVICRLPNASAEINGVQFSQALGGGMISEPVDEEKAKAFGRIPGYEVIDAIDAQEEHSVKEPEHEPHKRGKKHQPN